MRFVGALLGILLLSAIPAQAQTDPCSPAGGSSDTIQTGRPVVVAWTAPSAAVNDGYYVTVTAGTPTAPGAVVVAKLDVGKPAQVNCGAGTLGYQRQMSAGVPKGAYFSTVSAYNFVRDPVTGQPTTTRQESAGVHRPFDVVDPPTPPPTAPGNVKVTN